MASNLPLETYYYWIFLAQLLVKKRYSFEMLKLRLIFTKMYSVRVNLLRP
jgi:hypothetical protein